MWLLLLFWRMFEHDIFFVQVEPSEGKERLNTRTMQSLLGLNNDLESLPQAATGFLTHLNHAVMES